MSEAENCLNVYYGMSWLLNAFCSFPFALGEIMVLLNFEMNCLCIKIIRARGLANLLWECLLEMTWGLHLRFHSNMAAKESLNKDNINMDNVEGESLKGPHTYTENSRWWRDAECGRKNLSQGRTH